MLARAAARAAVHHQITAGTRHASLHHAHDPEIVGLHGKTGTYRTVHGHVSHKENVARAEADVLTYIEQTLDRDFPVVVKNVAVGG